MQLQIPYFWNHSNNHKISIRNHFGKRDIFLVITKNIYTKTGRMTFYGRREINTHTPRSYVLVTLELYSGQFSAILRGNCFYMLTVCIFITVVNLILIDTFMKKACFDTLNNFWYNNILLFLDQFVEDGIGLRCTKFLHSFSRRIRLPWKRLKKITWFVCGVIEKWQPT